MRLLITGIAGFIGSNIAFEAVTKGYDVSGIDDLSTGNEKNLAKRRNKIEFHKVSILDSEKLKDVMKDVDYVLHQAAIPSVPRSIKDPVETSKVNVIGTLNVLIAA